MFVDCSEISVNVIVKHKQHVGIIWPFVCLGGLVHFSVLEGEKKMLVYALLGVKKCQFSKNLVYIQNK